MAYSSWTQSRLYTYWIMGESENPEDQVLGIHPNWDDKGMRTLPYPKVDRYLEDRLALESWAKETLGTQITKQEILHLRNYLQAFRDEVDASNPQQ